MRLISVLLFALPLFISSNGFGQPSTDIPGGEWHYYSRDTMGSRYSPLDQVNKTNVKNLTRAWAFRTGDMLDSDVHYFECTPLMVGNTVYVITMFSRLVALDAVSGELQWEFNPDPPLAHSESGAGGLASRGVTYWKSGEKERLFMPVRDGRLYSIDIKTHKPDPGFGRDGMLNLREGIPHGGNYLFLSSPPAIYEDILIQGFGINDSSQRHNKTPLRAFDAHTGKELWKFYTIPNEGEFGADTWQNESWKGRGGGNVWSIMSVDRERGMLFLPVTTPNYDFYGGDRHGDNLFTDTVVALDIKTGKRLWHYQTVFHDLWDYDLAAQPNLIEITVDGKTIPAVAQAGKTAFIYVLNRETGEPVFPIEKREVPKSDIPGEETSPVQLFPSKPPAISRQNFTEADLSRLDEETHQYVLEKFKEYRAGTIFTPPSFEGTICFPGLHGGANWSGAAFDPDGMYYINSTELPHLLTLAEDEENPFKYRLDGSIQFRDQNGYPAVAPPWGQLIKIDMNKGEILWEKPLGEFPELTAKGIPPTGQENFGGATVTAGGLVLIASTMDGKIRAFDSDTGEILWQDQMEAAGYAAPITYQGSDGKQYVVICAGGGAKPGTHPHGDYVIAYRLEE